MSTETPLIRTMTARDVSVTERGQFRSCRRRWMLETLQNWTPKTPAWALEFGTGIHEALEVYYEYVKEGGEQNAHDNLGDVLDVFDEWHARVEDTQADLLGPLFTVDAKQELWDLRNLGRTMLTNYAEYSLDQAQADPWEIVAIEGRGLSAEDLGGTPPYDGDALPRIEEGRVVVPIVNPATGEVLEGMPCLSGRIDILIRKGKRRDLWVVDHKTTASSPSDRGLDFEDQITGYSYIVWRLTGVRPRGTIFNYLVKQVPKEPRMTQRGLSTAKDQLCLAKDYREALITEGLMSKGTITSDAHAECYAGLLNKGWDPYFKRFEPQRNEHEVRSFENRLYEEYRDMAEVAAEAATNHYRAYPNLSSYHGCPGCPVAPICQAMEDGSDVDGIIESRFMQAPDRKAQR